MTDLDSGTAAEWADVARRKSDHYRNLLAVDPPNDVAITIHERVLASLVPNLVEALDETLAQLAEVAELETHVARLRRMLAERGVEDPTWAGLSDREKAVLVAADDERLAGVR